MGLKDYSPQRASDNKSHNGPAEETQGHGLLASNTVHEEATDYAAREVEAVHHSSITDILDKGVVRIQGPNDGAAEDPA